MTSTRWDGHPPPDADGVRPEVRRWGGRAGTTPVAALRYPSTVWTYRTSAFVTAVILAPLLGTLLLAQDLRSFSGVATTTQLIVFPTVLGAAILLYVQYRLTGSNVVAWLTLCLSLYAVQGVMLAGLRAGRPDPFFTRPGWVLVIDLPVATLILVAVRLAPQVRLPVDPLGMGLLLGLLVAGVNLTATTMGPDLSMSSPPVVAAEVLLAGVGVGIGLAAWRLDEVPRWCAARMGLGTLALVANRLASCQDDNSVVDSIAVVAGIVGAVLMVNAAGSGLRFGIQQQRLSLTSLVDQVASLEAEEREGRARLHEITNSIASIAMASTLIHGHDDVPSSTRLKLVRMLESESGRLARVLTRTDHGSQRSAGDEVAIEEATVPQLVDLDEVIGPLVTSQQALERSVRWEPSGHVAIGDSDTVAEVVNILLDNSARHAPQSHTSIDVRRRGDTVEIAVRDDGPGLPADVRRTMFEWGGRGANSNGQGIGLHLASRLMTSDGNTLRLESDRAGTSFVVGLPAAADGRP